MSKMIWRWDEEDEKYCQQAIKRIESWPSWKKNVDILQQYKQPLPILGPGDSNAIQDSKEKM